MRQRMTAPRQVLPGTTYLITRRCLHRQFLLRPSRLTNAIFLYVLALAARRYGVRVHAFCVLSNHFHLVVTDSRAELPAFEQYLDGVVARAVNASLGRWESFWAPGSYSAVALEGPSDVVRKVAYTLANPVAAGLVRTGREWPGLWSAPEAIGGPAIVAHRPEEFFRASGYLPDSVELELCVPDGFDSAQRFRAELDPALASLEGEAFRGHVSRRVRFLGRNKVLSQRPWGRPASGEPRRQLNPRIASRDKWKRIEALCRLGEFVAAYREALRRFCAGCRDACFPRGTYLLRVRHGVRCETG
jgi:REP element-mobilizing transposase RayT